jgi:hypothetical protein
VVENWSLLNVVDVEVGDELGEFDALGDDATGVVSAMALRSGAHAADVPTTMRASAIAEITRPEWDTRSSVSAPCPGPNWPERSVPAEREKIFAAHCKWCKFAVYASFCRCWLCAAAATFL